MSEQHGGSVVLDGARCFFQVTFALLGSFVESLASVFWFLPGRYKSLTEDVIVITGGGKGLGRLIAVELAKHKPQQIILFGRHSDTLATTSKIIQSMHVKCDFMICDVSIRQQVFERAAEVKQKFGPVTMLINNAGVVFGNSILESRKEEVEKTIAVNTTAVFWTTQAFLPEMLEKNCGHLVFMNSVLGLMGLSGAADYVASKFGQLGFVESLAIEIMKERKNNVHVTSVHPYLINTDMFAGCTTRFPRLFPALDKDYVAWRTVDSILRNQRMVIIPRLMFLNNIIKCLIPEKALLALHRFTGVDRTMENFHHRQDTKKAS